MEEIWKPVRDLPYDVSNLGRVRSYVFAGKFIDHRGAIKPRIMHPVLAPYPRVTLCMNGKRINFFVHHLVLETFVSPRPANHVAHHKSGIITDNRLENLMWISYSDHNRLPGGPRSGGETHHNAKLKEDDVLEIRRLARQGMMQIHIAEKFSTTPQNVNLIIKRVNWTHI